MFHADDLNHPYVHPLRYDDVLPVIEPVHPEDQNRARKSGARPEMVSKLQKREVRTFRLNHNDISGYERRKEQNRRAQQNFRRRQGMVQNGF